MQYRKLGRTGVDVSAIGLGCAQLGSSRAGHATRIVERALELGVNYFDTARSYWDSEIKLGAALRGRREGVFVSSKTGAATREGAWQHIRESLERLDTDYVDNYHLHNIRAGDDFEERLGPGGALEALVEAREQGLIRHIGCTSHSAQVLVDALGRFDFEIVLVPMNIVERAPLEELAPLCAEKGVALTIMKPVATGLLPAPLALKWLLNQPIATAVPGATTVDEVAENSLAGHPEDVSLSTAEVAEAERLAAELASVRCRVCFACEPACPVDIPIGSVLGTDVMYDHYRTMGSETFARFPWPRERVAEDAKTRRDVMAKIEQTCATCGACEPLCPYGLPIVSMLQGMIPGMRDMLRVWGEEGVLERAAAPAGD